MPAFPANPIKFSISLPCSYTAGFKFQLNAESKLNGYHGHANQFATTGEVRLHDTGERDLQLLCGPLAPVMDLATRQAGASRSLFVFGTRLAVPKTFLGALGSLGIQRSQPLRVFNRPADSTGRSDLSVAPSRLDAQLGASYAVQGAARVAGGLRFTEIVLTPPRF